MAPCGRVASLHLRTAAGRPSRGFQGRGGLVPTLRACARWSQAGPASSAANPGRTERGGWKVGGRLPPPLPAGPPTAGIPPARGCGGRRRRAGGGAGARAALEEVHRRYARPVLGLALRRLGDRGRAEDATQEAFASVWRSARSYDPARGAGAPWLYAVARNAIVDGLRKS